MILQVRLIGGGAGMQGFTLDLPNREDQTRAETRADLLVAGDTFGRFAAIIEGREDARGRPPHPGCAPPPLPAGAVWDIVLYKGDP